MGKTSKQSGRARRYKTYAAQGAQELNTISIHRPVYLDSAQHDAVRAAQDSVFEVLQIDHALWGAQRMSLDALRMALLPPSDLTLRSRKTNVNTRHRLQRYITDHVPQIQDEMHSLRCTGGWVMKLWGQDNAVALAFDDPYLMNEQHDLFDVVGLQGSPSLSPHIRIATVQQMTPEAVREVNRSIPQLAASIGVTLGPAIFDIRGTQSHR